MFGARRSIKPSFSFKAGSRRRLTTLFPSTEPTSPATVAGSPLASPLSRRKSQQQDDPCLVVATVEVLDAIQEYVRSGGCIDGSKERQAICVVCLLPVAPLQAAGVFRGCLAHATRLHSACDKESSSCPYCRLDIKGLTPKDGQYSS